MSPELIFSFIIAGIIGLVILFFLGWFLLRFLLRTFLLLKYVLNLSNDSGAIVVRGSVQLTKPLDIEGIPDCLWYEGVTEQYVDVGYRAGWEFQGSNVYVAEFSVQQQRKTFQVIEAPTDCSGTQKRSKTHHGDVRVNEQWLPIVSELTVVGKATKHHDLFLIEQSKLFGLAISPNTPLHMLTINLGIIVFFLACAGLVTWPFL